jgi:hypothetical protein
MGGNRGWVHLHQKEASYEVGKLYLCPVIPKLDFLTRQNTLSRLNNKLRRPRGKGTRSDLYATAQTIQRSFESAGLLRRKPVSPHVKADLLFVVPKSLPSGPPTHRLRLSVLGRHMDRHAMGSKKRKRRFGEPAQRDKERPRRWGADNGRTRGVLVRGNPSKNKQHSIQLWRKEFVYKGLQFRNQRTVNLRRVLRRQRQ